MKTTHIKLCNTFFIALPIIFLIGCCRPIEKIVIISTNDIHGAIDAFPRLATFVEDVRRADTAAVLLIDAGDRWTGNPYTDLAEKRGYPIIELMNTLGYDYSTVGNHEFDHGQQLLAERIGDSKFQNILANMAVIDADFPVLPPYKIIKIGNTKIALFGMVHNYENGHPDGKPQIFTGLEFGDPVCVARTYKSYRDSANVFIAVTHIGAGPDSIVAAAVPELDLIIGGHSHTVLENGKKFGKTLVTQAGSNLRYVGVTTITMQGDKMLDIHNSLVKLDSIAPSPKYQQMVDGYKNNPALTKSVGSMAQYMTKLGIVNWMTDVIRKSTKTDIAFYNMGGVRVDHFDQGDINVANVFAMEPFGSVMYTFEMTPAQIKALIINKFNSNGKTSQVSDLYPSGIKYTVVRGENGTGTDVVFTPKLVDGRVYKVALSDYVSSAYIFDQQGGGKSTETLLTNVLMDELKKNSPIKADTINRVTVPKVTQN